MKEAYQRELASIEKAKTALFIVTPDSDKSYAFLIGLLYEQLMQELYFQADTKHGGRKAGYQGLCDYLKSA
jgi:type IV secretory pathway TraG/TraD family ATPase VirD4